MTSGYSGTPLPTKLGIRANARLLLLNAPPLPPSIRCRRMSRPPPPRLRRLRRCPRLLSRRRYPAAPIRTDRSETVHCGRAVGVLAKKASGVSTDLTEHWFAARTRGRTRRRQGRSDRCNVVRLEVRPPAPRSLASTCDRADIRWNRDVSPPTLPRPGCCGRDPAPGRLRSGPSRWLRRAKQLLLRRFRPTDHRPGDTDHAQGTTPVRDRSLHHHRASGVRNDRLLASGRHRWFGPGSGLVASGPGLADRRTISAGRSEGGSER